MFLERKLKDQSVWINIDSDDVEKNEQIYQDYNIDLETIEYALDKNERAHMDYNRENGTVLFIYNVLNLATEKDYYETLPMTFIVQSNRLITISNEDNAYVVDIMKAYMEHHEPVSVYKFLFASLELISNSYYPVIEQLDKRKDEINRILRQKTTKKHLFSLSDLETSMVYLVAAAKQNNMLLEHIKSHAVYRGFDELETEQFEDAMIEARQLVSMTDLIAQVLSQLSGSYNNILNNNLNDNLTVLTIISVLLAVLAVITGFFGMNVPLPWSRDKNAWLYIVTISLVLWALLTKLLNWVVNKER
ncbi:magnesium transporter CorA family protein [Streptococcus sinensis]|uniref:magnesium transporter CorA family protein n=1 Tax=Streptococcus sinensis TaxID=176090 RepID=UPI00272C1038|nr:magnesium transporter CorA family protein [Streptococcus sinensis]